MTAKPIILIATAVVLAVTAFFVSSCARPQPPGGGIYRGLM
jgi:hypothetical protein